MGTPGATFTNGTSGSRAITHFAPWSVEYAITPMPKHEPTATTATTSPLARLTVTSLHSVSSGAAVLSFVHPSEPLTVRHSEPSVPASTQVRPERSAKPATLSDGVAKAGSGRSCQSFPASEERMPMAVVTPRPVAIAVDGSRTATRL
jgi:hypothetical protein